MPNGESNVVSSLASVLPVALISVLGGALDYFYAIQIGKRIWSMKSFALHLALSIFFGYISALALVGMGYSVEVAGAGAGAVGFLNIRVVDLITLYFKKRSGGKNG